MNITTLVEAEISLLRHAMIYPRDTIPVVSIDSIDFSDSRNQKLWESILELYGKSEPATIDSIELSELSGVPSGYMQDILNTKTIGRDPIPWAEYVRREATERRYRSVLEFGLGSEGEDVYEAIGCTLDALSKLLRHGGAELETPRELMREICADVENIATGNALVGIDVGFSCIKNSCSGIPTEVLTLVGAPPSIGKTALMLNMLIGAAKDGSAGLFYSLEDNKKNIARRLLAIASGLNLKSIRTGQLDTADWGKMHKAADWLSNLPYRIVDRSLPTIEKIEMAVRRDARDIGARIVFVDYMQLIRSSRKFKSRNDELDYIGTRLKVIAKELGIALVVGSQLRRKNMSDGEKPTMDMLRDSGSLEQHAHVIMMLYRRRAEDVTELLLEKNKDGPAPTTLYLKFLARCASFVDLPDDEIRGYHAKYSKRRGFGL